MIAASHLIVGAIIGDLIQNFPLAFLAGFISHFIFDAIPHLEHDLFVSRKDIDNLKLPRGVIIFEFFEIIVGVVLLFWFFIIQDKNVAILWAAFGAILPDLIDNVPFWSLQIRKIPGFKQFHKFHDGIHTHLKRKDWIFGVPIYIIIIGFAIWVLIK